MAPENRTVRNTRLRTALLVAALLLLLGVPYLLHPGAAFQGSDDRAAAAIGSQRPRPKGRAGLAPLAGSSGIGVITRAQIALGAGGIAAFFIIRRRSGGSPR